MPKMKEENFKQVLVRLRDEVHGEIEKIAARENNAVSRVTRRLVEKGLAVERGSAARS